MIYLCVMFPALYFHYYFANIVTLVHRVSSEANEGAAAAFEEALDNANEDNVAQHQQRGGSSRCAPCAPPCHPLSFGACIRSALLASSNTDLRMASFHSRLRKCRDVRFFSLK